MARDLRVCQRRREARLGDEREEALLELAAGDLGIGVGEGGEGGPQTPRPAPPSIGQPAMQLVGIEAPQDFGAVADPLELVWRGGGGGTRPGPPPPAPPPPPPTGRP